MAWHNPDGLYVRFGREEANINNGGEYKTYGHTRDIEFVIDLADLTASEVVQNRNIIIPQDTKLYAVEVVTDTAAATGTAIDVGLVRLDTSETEVDYDGILAAFPTGNMDLAGEKFIYNDTTVGSGYGGALVGLVMSTTYPTWITASRTDSTAFTAGRIRITLKIAPASSTT